MKAVARLYYALYLLSGGYRHFSFEYLFFGRLTGHVDDRLWLALTVSEWICFGLAVVLLVYPLHKKIHLLFFSILFVSDCFFQNFVKFESSVILTHLFPLFVFLYLHYSQKTKEIDYSAILLVSVGYLTSFLSKTLSGWWMPGEAVVYGYVLEFTDGYHIGGYLSDGALRIHDYRFWKAVDYVVLLFQAGFVINFFRTAYIRYQLLLAALFHLGILFLFGIGVFYPYLLFYALILARGKAVQPASAKGLDVFLTFAASVAVLVAVPGQSPHFVYEVIGLWLYAQADAFLTLFCFGVFLYFLFTTKRPLHATQPD